MNESNGIRIERVEAGTLFDELKRVAIFQQATEQDVLCLGTVELIHAEKDAIVVDPATPERSFWILLEGEIVGEKIDEQGVSHPLAAIQGGEAFGEVPLLAGKPPSVHGRAAKASRIVRLDEEAFWQLMFECPSTRRMVLGNMAQRMEYFQTKAMHKEKLAALGTLAAGLMHELNNPGAAAKRAAAMLRENIQRMQQVSLSFCERPFTDEQKQCLKALQEQAFAPVERKPADSVEEMDREDEMSCWLNNAGVRNPERVAPTLCSVGFTAKDLGCAQALFEGDQLSDTFHWLDAMLSSVQQVATIEESVARMTELVYAVKKFAYEGKKTGQAKIEDVHDSIYSTLVILGHKLRLKQLQVVKEFTAEKGALERESAGLGQVWTNLLDNAIDAAPESSRIGVRTWVAGNELYVSISDEGAGILPEIQDRIFEPFFTTKPLGVGTGLGLDIVKQIVEQKFDGRIRLESSPGHTEFVVILPLRK